MNEEVSRCINGSNSEDPSALDNPIPTQTQLNIISKVVGERKGTKVSGVGANVRRPPRPRGGATNIALKQEIVRLKEEAAKKDAEFDQRIKNLEDQMRATLGIDNSEAASSGRGEVRAIDEA